MSEESRTERVHQTSNLRNFQQLKIHSRGFIYTSHVPTKAYRDFPPTLKYSINSTRSEATSRTKYVS